MLVVTMLVFRKPDLLTDVALIINRRLETLSLPALAERKVGNDV